MPRYDIEPTERLKKATMAAHEAQVAAEAKREQEAAKGRESPAAVTVLSPRRMIDIILRSPEFEDLVDELLADPIAFANERSAG